MITGNTVRRVAWMKRSEIQEILSRIPLRSTRIPLRSSRATLAEAPP